MGFKEVLATGTARLQACVRVMDKLLYAAVGGLVTMPSSASMTTSANAKIIASCLPSTIRLMTRLAIKAGVVNLSQGFERKATAEMLLAAAGALIDGETPETAAKYATTLEKLVRPEKASANSKDSLNQYSLPAWRTHSPPGAQRVLCDLLPGGTRRSGGESDRCTRRDGGLCNLPAHSLRAGRRRRLLPALSRALPCSMHALGHGAARGDAVRRMTISLVGCTIRLLSTRLCAARRLCYSTLHTIQQVRSSLRPSCSKFGDLCAKHNVLIVTDEIYEHIIFDGVKHTSLAQLPGMAERTLIVNALSKTARATGWRVGWVVSPKRFTPSLRAVHDQLVLQAPSPLQFGSATMLRLGRKAFNDVHLEYLPKREILLTALRRGGLYVGAVPEGAYYLFVGYHSVPALKGLSPTEATMKMIEEYKVACVPGDNFYLGKEAKADPQRGGRYLRFTFVRSIDVLKEGAEKLKALQ